MRRVLATLVTVGCLWVTAACGDDTTASESDEPSPTGTTASPTETEESPTGDDEGPEPVRIDVNISGHEVSPSGERVEAQAGEPIELVVTADAPGEIHVHSSPEQTLSYDAGKTTLEFTIERPGVVEVESHEAHQVIVQLEVR